HYLLKLFVLSLLIIEVIALFLYSKSKNRTDENFSISPIYYRTQKSGTQMAHALIGSMSNWTDESENGS
ncbi:hypothetical protein, partial [Staphylococcus aureus]|uniref:hypothetical protein n=1 Tax=Staphylococcus aureus TaxID=1280 RepID=UPI0011527997